MFFLKDMFKIRRGGMSSVCTLCSTMIHQNWECNALSTSETYNVVQGMEYIREMQ